MDAMKLDNLEKDTNQPKIPLTMTMEEYEALPEGVYAEVIDGVVYRMYCVTPDIPDELEKFAGVYGMASPSIQHQDIVGELYMEINSYLRSKKGNCKAFISPLDIEIKSDPTTVVQPDLFVVCDKSKLEGRTVKGSPDWVIEIVSPSNIESDYIRKLQLYHAAGVREYWIINPMDETIIVYDWDEENFQLDKYSFHDTIHSVIYPDLAIDFESINTRVNG